MSVGERAERRRWLGGLGVLRGGGGDQTYVSLLEALARDKLESQAVERELDATSRTSEADILEDEQRIERDGLAEARREVDDFRAALEDMRTRAGGPTRREVPYDSGDAQKDEMADVLIQYLVRPGYAEVRTEEASHGGYVYWISVDWPKLRALAESQGHPLPE